MPLVAGAWVAETSTAGAALWTIGCTDSAIGCTVSVRGCTVSASGWVRGWTVSVRG
jgi:hypothetical protein